MGISQGGEGQGSIFTQINITPLTDIFLVLLIIMMVIAPMFQNANQEIEAPAIKGGESIETNMTTVEITKEGNMYLNGQQVTAEKLPEGLSTAVVELTDKRLIVKADKSTHSSEVMKVFEAASQAGFEKLTIAGEPLSNSRQNELDSSPAGEVSQ